MPELTASPSRLSINEINSDQLDALYTRAESAEAAVYRVRALTERWRHTSDRKEGPRRELLASLDPFVEQPDDPFSHTARLRSGRAGGLCTPPAADDTTEH